MAAGNPLRLSGCWASYNHQNALATPYISIHQRKFMKNDTLSLQSRFGPWALIAGASTGLGAEYAHQLASKGLNLVLVARHEIRLQTLAEELRSRYSTQVREIVCDLSHPDAAGQIADQTGDLEIGLMIYNAAVAPVAPFFEISLEQHLNAIDTNVRTPLAMVYLFGQAMRARHRGGIILMSSLSAMQGSALLSNYAATKAYNLVLAEGLWDELRQDGIAVLVCLPASIATPNYLVDLPEGKRSPTQTLPPQQVAAETLAALGKQSVIIPGWTNRIASFVLRHLFPRQSAVRLMGRVLRGMYNR
jgi:short-subunit dehydrogenase